LTPIALPVIERNIVPDWILRSAIRQEIEMELAKIYKLTSEERAAKVQAFVEELKTMPIAIQQAKANDQHYEVPDEFYTTVSHLATIHCCLLTLFHRSLDHA
jgi:cyclopropane-fatty-acyl-phospholipid synthase